MKFSATGNREGMRPDEVMDSDSLYTQAAYNRQKMKLHLSSDSLEDSLEEYDSDSLSEERRYQSELQNRIQMDEENFLYTANGEREDVETKDMGTPHQDPTDGVHSNSRARIVETSYSELRYDPDWRREQSVQNRSSEEDEEALDESPRYSDLLSPEVPRHKPHRSNTSGHNVTNTIHSNAQSKITRTQPAQHQPSNDRTRRRRSLSQNRTTTDKISSKELHDAARKDFIEKNKATLGVRGQRNNSYLQFYKKNSNENASDQNNIKPVTSESQPMKEIKGKSPLEMASTEEQGFTDGRSKQRTSKTANMESLLSVRKNNMESSSGQPKDEFPETGYFPPGRLRNIYFQPQEHPEIYIESFANWNEKPQELTLNGNVGVTAGDSFDKHFWSSQLERQSLQKFSITSPVTHNLGHDTFLPEHNVPPKKDSPEFGDRKSNPDNGQQPRKGHRVEEKNQKMLINYLKQDIKLGGIGPSHIISQERKEQLNQQKEYAKIIQERNRNKPMKVCEVPIVQNEKGKGPRQKSLEYAKNIPRPQQSPKASNEKQLDGGVRRAISYDTLLPHNKLLEDLKARHEQEKVAVAAIGALHII